MRKGTHHSAETRLAIRLKRLEKSMPPEEFAQFMAADGALKWCPLCKRLLPAGEFFKNKRAWDGLYDRCKECASALASAGHRKRLEDPGYREQRRQRAAEWREAAKADGRMVALNKKYSLKQLYGMSTEQFEAMLAAQRHRCAICLCRFENSRDAHVDHDHATGVVRGLLCTHCNNGLGRFRDNPAALRRAARYVERARSAPPVPADRGRDALWEGAG